MADPALLNLLCDEDTDIDDISTVDEDEITGSGSEYENNLSDNSCDELIIISSDSEEEGMKILLNVKCMFYLFIFFLSEDETGSQINEQVNDNDTASG